jgi:hypothetical protein
LVIQNNVSTIKTSQLGKDNNYVLDFWKRKI